MKARSCYSESQLDRCSTVLTLRYPAPEAELDLLARGGQQATDPGDGILDGHGVAQTTIQQAVPRDSYRADVMLNYPVRCHRAHAKTFSYPTGARASRAALSLLQLARAQGFSQSRAYVLPDDAEELAVPSLAHRITLRTNADDGENSHYLFVRFWLT